jgi:hypothetical protein
VKFTLSRIAALGLAAVVALLALPLKADIIADSSTEFSGNADLNAVNGWQYGYRIVTATLGTPEYANYDPFVEFVPFQGGDTMGPWNGSDQQWSGSAWDLETAAAAPWTWIAQTNIHPNSANNGGEHWPIRRWLANELTAPGPLAITWSVRKENLSGNGVTGALYVNGVPLDMAVIAGNNGVGVTHTVYINANVGDAIDLVLTPVGPGGTTDDGADGSYNWMTIDTTIPVGARQPNGVVFVPLPIVDTDKDGLPDVWELAFTTNSLTQLTATGDSDADGWTDVEEFALGTDPTKTDTDNDGLADKVETNTGTFVDANDTGTDPLKADTDGDGRLDGDEVNGPLYSNPLMLDTDGDTYSDGDEAATGHDPNDANNNVIASLIANSRTEFSGNQGENDWFYGYRNYTADGGGPNYNPTNGFIQFDASAWQNGQWDLTTAEAAPWTELGRENTHPNTGGAVHWTIRRWVATELTQKSPLTIRWHMRKTNITDTGGNGVTGGVYVNGIPLDIVVIAGTNGVGVTRTVYANVNPGDMIDLILSPRGTDGLDIDGQDGSANWMQIDPFLPDNPVQPNGTVFIPSIAPDRDNDGMPDAWEKLYFPNDLTKLTATGDNDKDGLKDADEYLRDSDPTKTDTDGDGLSDLVETKTGAFVDANDTGTDPSKVDTDGDGISDFDEIKGALPHTNPTLADTDGDGFSDSAEIAEESDPNDLTDTPVTFVIADSIKEFSGVQGQDGWHNGYRNYTADGGGTDYDPSVQFLAYDPSMWDGGAWNLDPGGEAPWTYQAAQDLHPNGINSGGEHWNIRRWVAEEVTEVTAVKIVWHVRKTNLNNDGVTGLLFINGVLADSMTIAGNDGVGVTRKFYANLQPGDIVDLALSPQGLSNRDDGSDGSITWFRVDKRLGKEPRRADGTLFIPANMIGVDADKDGLLDFWETVVAGSLTALTGTGDNDNDGLDNLGEMERDSNPLLADTDGDGLSDAVETKTGTFVGPNDTGSNPRLTDSDGDGFPDAVEVQLGTDPNDPASSPIIANAWTEFSGNQGEKDWFYGYRDLLADGGANDYDPNANFIPFPPESWRGDRWDLAIDTSPWTQIYPGWCHPAGESPLHWPLWRWVANSITAEKPLAVRYHALKNNVSCGNGTTVSIYINGVEADKVILNYNDGAGFTRTYYAMVKPGDIIDLALKSAGTVTTDPPQNDWCDGTTMGMELSTYIPPNPVQPDGTPFVVPSTAPKFVSITCPTPTLVNLKWTSLAGATYKLEAGADLKTWQTVKTGIASGGTETTYGDSLTPPAPSTRFYRVSKE